MIYCILIGALLGLIIYLYGRIGFINNQIKFNREALEYKLIGESARLQDEMLQLKIKMDKIDAAMSLVLADIHNRNMKVPSKPTPLPPANRHPRSEEQKKLAAEKKKKWWADKRRLAAEISFKPLISLKDGQDLVQELKKRQEQNGTAPFLPTTNETSTSPS